MLTTSMLATWLQQRTRTLIGIAIGTVTWLLATAVAWQCWPAVTLATTDRIPYALQLAAAPALLILLMTCSCLRLFDTVEAEDPLRDRVSPRFRINQRVLTNTVEQAWIFVPLLLALATRLPDGQLRVLPIATAFWCAGRLMFWAGYHVAPHWRAPGFDWTFWTSGVVAGWFVCTLF